MPIISDFPQIKMNLDENLVGKLKEMTSPRVKEDRPAESFQLQIQLEIVSL